MLHDCCVACPSVCVCGTVKRILSWESSSECTSTDPPAHQRTEKLPDRRAWVNLEPASTCLVATPPPTHPPARQSVPPSVSPSARESVSPLSWMSTVCTCCSAVSSVSNRHGRRHDVQGTRVVCVCAKRAKQRDPTRPPRAKPCRPCPCCACPSQPELGAGVVGIYRQKPGLHRHAGPRPYVLAPSSL